MNIDAVDFEKEVLKSEIPVLVDFYAEWCMPCKMIAPILEQLETEYTGRMKIVKIDTDKAADIVNKYNVRSIPTLVFFKAGEIVDQVMGAVPKHALTEKIEKII